MNSLLKFTLTLAISFSLVTSVLAQKQQTSDPNTTNPPTTSNNLGNQPAPNQPGDTENKDEQNKNTSRIKGKIEDSAKNNNLTNSTTSQKQISKDKKSLGLTDILLLLNLLTSIAFFSLWFFKQKKLQEKINNLIKNPDQILNQSKKINEINSNLNKLETSKGKIVKELEALKQNNLKSQDKIYELLSKQQSSHYQNNYNNSTPLISQFQSQPHFTSVAIVDKSTQLIDKYNQDRNSFLSQAIDTVAETQESIEQRRSGSSNTVILEHTNKKKYLIIEEDNQYYLIPHANISIDEYNIKTLEYLFDCTNFTAEHSNFELIKPAKVSKQPSETWQIEEKGKLNFN